MSSKSEKLDIIIVGTGLSGLVAADLLSEYSLNILVVDENLQPGGQYVPTAGRDHYGEKKDGPQITQIDADKRGGRSGHSL